MSKVCRRCIVEKDESEFKDGHKVCRSCRSRMDYKSFVKRNSDPVYKKHMRAIRNLGYKNNPWNQRLCDAGNKLTGSKKYTALPTDTLHLLASKRLIGLIEKKMIKQQEASVLYKKLKTTKQNRESFMVTMKEIFNLPKVEGGLNAR